MPITTICFYLELSVYLQAQSSSSVSASLLPFSLLACLLFAEKCASVQQNVAQFFISLAEIQGAQINRMARQMKDKAKIVLKVSSDSSMFFTNSVRPAAKVDQAEFSNSTSNRAES